MCLTVAFGLFRFVGDSVYRKSLLKHILGRSAVDTRVGLQSRCKMYEWVKDSGRQ